MSYAQAMRWQKKHPTGGKAQYMGFSAGSGFWPSCSWTRDVAIPYYDACEAAGVVPLNGETLYRLTLRNRVMAYMSAKNRAEYTRLMRLRAIEEPDNKELTIFR